MFSFEEKIIMLTCNSVTCSEGNINNSVSLHRHVTLIIGKIKLISQPINFGWSLTTFLDAANFCPISAIEKVCHFSVIIPLSPWGTWEGHGPDLQLS